MADDDLEARTAWWTEFDQQQHNRAADAIWDLLADLHDETYSGPLLFSALGAVLTRLFLSLEPEHRQQAVREWLSLFKHRVETALREAE